MARKAKSSDEPTEGIALPTQQTAPETDADEAAARRRYGTSVRISDEFVSAIKDASGIEGLTVSEYADKYLTHYVKWLYARRLYSKLEGIGHEPPKDLDTAIDFYIPPHIERETEAYARDEKNWQTLRVTAHKLRHNGQTYKYGDAIFLDPIRAKALVREGSGFIACKGPMRQIEIRYVDLMNRGGRMLKKGQVELVDIDTAKYLVHSMQAAEFVNPTDDPGEA